MNSGRWMQWKDAGRSRPRASAPRPLDPGRGVPARARSSTRSRAGSSRTPVMALTLNYKDPIEAGARRDLSGDQRLRPDDRQAARHLRQAEGRRHDDRGQLDLHRLVSRGRQPVEAPRRRPGSRRRTTRPAWASTTGGRGAGRSTAASCTTAPRPIPTARPWDPSRPGIQWDAAEKSGTATCPTTRRRWTRETPSAWGPFIMNGEGVGPAVLELDARRAVPRALRAGRVAGREPAAPKQSGVAGVFLYDKEGGRAEPLRHRRGVPVHRDQLPADRARALRHPARASAGRAAARGRSSRSPKRSRKEKGIETGDRVRVMSKRGKLEVRRVVTKRLGRARRSTARRSSTSGSRSTGATSASPPTGTRPRAPTGSPTR